MSSATPLYRETVSKRSTHDEIDRAVEALRTGAPRWRTLSANERARLLRQCLDGVAKVASQWATASCLAKGIAPGSTTEAEEWLAGPVATARCLRLTIGAIEETEQFGFPRLSASRIGFNDQIHIPVFPGRGLFDSLLFRGFKAEVRLTSEAQDESIQSRPPSTAGVCLILGAGNVSTIPIADALHQFWNAGHVVLLKMNPVNEYLGPLFEQAFAPLMENNFLRIIYGGADVGQSAAHHPRIDAVHITGSIHAHEAIVWGDASDRTQRKLASAPRLTKPITSELGNVTPWIIVPGNYSRRQLVYQAENLAASITNNASFNCIATKMIVTCRTWQQRKEFLDLIEAHLAKVSPRKAYYPGAIDRFHRFAGKPMPASIQDGHVPWTLRRNVSADNDPILFGEESFTCVCAETAIDADSPENFLHAAVDFANSRLWGTLACTITVPNKLRPVSGRIGAIDRAIAKLRYGTVAINHWAGIAFGLMSTPWGGAPGATLVDPQSGIGWVHNPLLLNHVEKSILIGPLTSWPKPPWFPSHRGALPLAKRLFQFYEHPALMRLLPVFFHAIRS